MSDKKVCTKPDCFPYCDCGSADDYVPATPSEDGGELSDTDESWSAALLEVAVVLEAVSSRDSAERLANMNAGKTLGRAFGRLKSIRAQHSRIVAAKDAEIARLRDAVERYAADAVRWANEANALRAKPARNEVVIDLDALAWESIKEAANNSPWMPEQYMLNDWVADVCAFLREPARQVGGDEREQFEAHMQSASFNDHDWFRRHPVRTDEYDNPGMQSDWVLWQARAALAPAAVDLTDDEILEVMRPNIDYADGGYACDTMPEKVVEAGRDLIARLNRRALLGKSDG